MRWLSLSGMLFFTVLVCGQTLQLSNTSSDYQEIVGLSTIDVQSMAKKNALNKVEGSPYLYESWANESKLFFNGKVYNFTFFNYNMYADRFEAKIAADSVFVINANNVEKVEINNLHFKRFYDSELRRDSYFEELIDFKGYKLLKKHTVKIRKGTVNSLTKVKMNPDSLVPEVWFYSFHKATKNLNKIKLKKKSILSLIDERNQNEVSKYVKNNRQSYSNTEDVLKILQFYNTL
tara:strand:- start:16367 stop:17068 length:702 start_codon:yes stop_codon:yes gene_type:complete